MVILLQKTADDEDIKKAIEDHLDYIKITVDIEKEIVAIGGMYNADAEKELLNLRSKQENIWGGGFDTITNSLDFVTDIRRAVYCILNKNIPTARSFLAKADFLVEHELKLGNVDKKLRFNFYNYWKNIYQQKKFPVTVKIRLNLQIYC